MNAPWAAWYESDRVSDLPSYLLSLPERAARSLTALAGGLARNVGEIAIPPSVRRTHLYRAMVDGTLKFLIQQAGHVEGVYSSDEQLAKDFLVRRGAGNGLEMVGLLTFHLSPVWVLAALADVSGAGKQLIGEIAAELEKKNLLEPGERFETVEQILDGLERTAGRAAEAVNTPPLNVEALREEWNQIRRHAAVIPSPRLPSANQLWTTWDAIKSESRAQNASVFEVSTLMAMSALRTLPKQAKWLGLAAAHATRRTGKVFAGTLLDHYAATLRGIHDQGYLTYCAREFKPYMQAALANFSPSKTTFTERLLKRGR